MSLASSRGYILGAGAINFLTTLRRALSCPRCGCERQPDAGGNIVQEKCDVGFDCEWIYHELHLWIFQNVLGKWKGEPTPRRKKKKISDEVKPQYASPDGT